jgi:hypothetical protein
MHDVLAGTQNQPIPLVDSERAEAGAKAGAEVGAKAGVEVGAKAGVEVGAKAGVEVGAKAGVEVGSRGLGSRGLCVDPGYYPW